MARMSRNVRITVSKSGRWIIRSHRGARFLRATLTNSVSCDQHGDAFVVRTAIDPVRQIAEPDDFSEGNREFVAPAHG